MVVIRHTPGPGGLAGAGTRTAPPLLDADLVVVAFSLELVARRHVLHQRQIATGDLALTLDPQRIARRGYFDPAKVKALQDKMATGEFIYLKQVLSLVMLELWQMIFIDKELP